MTELETLKIALGVSVAAISTEHFFSAGLSSPWSTAKFATTPEDQAQVWRLFWNAAGASVIFALIIGAMLDGKNAVIYSVLGAVAVSAFMYWEYNAALSGNL